MPLRGDAKAYKREYERVKALPKELRRAHMKAWRMSRPDFAWPRRTDEERRAQVREAAKRFRERNPSYAKDWRNLNLTPDLMREYRKRWEETNPGALLAMRKKSGMKTVEKYRTDKDAFKRKACPDCGIKKLSPGRCSACHDVVRPKADPKKREASNRRHNAKRSAVKRGDSVPAEMIDPLIVFERDGYRCRYCRTETPIDLRGSKKARAPELDHVVAISKGGHHTYQNVALACRRCNLKKSAKDVGEFLRELGVSA